jgi:hypothetical protein
MYLSRLRRRTAPVALVSYIALVFSQLPVRAARADESREAAPVVEPARATSPARAESKATTTTPPSADPSVEARPPPGGSSSPSRETTERVDPAILADLPAGAPEPMAPTVGGDKTGVSSQAISVPQGAGKVQGMGESFSTQMSTGVATFSVPFALPHARGAVQPSLSLSYSSSSGHGLAGVGWDVGVPFLARQTDRGLPKFDDRAAWNPEQDRFVFNGGQELVPICTVAGTACTEPTAALLPGEVLPSWAGGWQYFRARVEGSYLRFFWSADHRTWRVQSKNGDTMELGVPLDGSGDTSGLESDPARAAHVFRWNLARQYDAQADANGAPVNLVRYRYVASGAMAYLTDVYDTPPASNASAAPLSAYAHHTRLRYANRPDATFSFRRGWRVDQALRFSGVDVTSKTFTEGAAGQRRMLRRYALTYDAMSHVSLLAKVQVEGRCGAFESQSTAEDGTGSLPDVTGCPALPAMGFGYQRVAPYSIDRTQSAPAFPGYEGFDERVVEMKNSPPHSLDDQLADLFDVNSDGLPDVVATAPGLYNGKHAVFFNGADGTLNAFAPFRPMSVTGVPGEDENIIKLSNYNLTVHDIDGDGTADLLHMPKVKTYSVYTPKLVGAEWAWQGRAITTASQQSPKLDFAGHSAATRVMDVNGDGLVDVVFSSGTEYQTFFSLGRYPAGDGQYGSATWTGASTASVVNDPVTSCLPWSGAPALLSDPDVRVGDMNGDGLPDIVRMRAGDLRYWPGRGNGFWGTGDPSTCPGGGFGQGRDIAMTTSTATGSMTS